MQSCMQSTANQRCSWRAHLGSSAPRPTRGACSCRQPWRPPPAWTAGRRCLLAPGDGRARCWLLQRVQAAAGGRSEALWCTAAVAELGCLVCTSCMHASGMSCQPQAAAPLPRAGPSTQHIPPEQQQPPPPRAQGIDCPVSRHAARTSRIHRLAVHSKEKRLASRTRQLLRHQLHPPQADAPHERDAAAAAAACALSSRGATAALGSRGAGVVALGSRTGAALSSRRAGALGCRAGAATRAGAGSAGCVRDSQLIERLPPEIVGPPQLWFIH